MAGRFRPPKSKEEETSLVSEATPKATQYNTKWGRKVFEEWQQRRQNTCAMLQVVGVADLKCEDVQDLTVSPQVAQAHYERSAYINLFYFAYIMTSTEYEFV